MFQTICEEKIKRDFMCITPVVLQTIREWVGYVKTQLSFSYLNINQLDALNFIMSLFHASTCFEHHVLRIRWSKLYYTAPGIITPIGGRPVYVLREDSPVHRTATYRYDDTRGCIIHFDLLKMST